MFEDNVGGVLSLHDAPMIAKTELVYDGAISLSKEVEPVMEGLYFEIVTEALSQTQICNRREHIVHEGKGDVFFG